MAEVCEVEHKVLASIRSRPSGECCLYDLFCESECGCYGTLFAALNKMAAEKVISVRFRTHDWQYNPTGEYERHEDIPEGSKPSRTKWIYREV